MADLFARLARRTLGLMPVVQPKITSRFAQEEAMAGENANLEIPSLFSSDRGLLPGTPADAGFLPSEKMTGGDACPTNDEESSIEKSILVARGDPENQELTPEMSAISEARRESRVGEGRGRERPEDFQRKTRAIGPIKESESIVQRADNKEIVELEVIGERVRVYATEELRGAGERRGEDVIKVTVAGEEKKERDRVIGEKKGESESPRRIIEVDESGGNDEIYSRRKELSSREEEKRAIGQKVESVESESRGRTGTEREFRRGEESRGEKRAIGPIVESVKSASPDGSADGNKEKRSRAIARKATAEIFSRKASSSRKEESGKETGPSDPVRESEVKWPGLDRGRESELDSREEVFGTEEGTGAIAPRGSRESVRSESPDGNKEKRSKEVVQRKADESRESGRAIALSDPVRESAVKWPDGGRKSENTQIRSRREEGSSRSQPGRAIASRPEVQHVDRVTVEPGKEYLSVIAREREKQSESKESSSNTQIRSRREEGSSRSQPGRAMAPESRLEVEYVDRVTVEVGRENIIAIAREQEKQSESKESSSNTELSSRREELSSRYQGERAIASRPEVQHVDRVTVEQGKEDRSAGEKQSYSKGPEEILELSSRREEGSSRSQGGRAIASRPEVQHVDRVTGEQSREDIRAIAREREKQIELSSREVSSKSQRGSAIGIEGEKQSYSLSPEEILELSSRREELSSRSQPERAIGPTETDLPDNLALVLSQIAGREEENNRENVGREERERRRREIELAARSQVQLSGSRLAEKQKASIASTPAIEITIGKIEVRGTKPAVKPVQQSRRQPTSPSPRLSLDEYLKQRNGGKR